MEKGFSTLMSLYMQTILSLSLENAHNARTEKKNYIVCKQHQKVAFVCMSFSDIRKEPVL